MISLRIKIVDLNLLSSFRLVLLNRSININRVFDLMNTCIIKILKNVHDFIFRFDENGVSWSYDLQLVFFCFFDFEMLNNIGLSYIEILGNA